MDHKIRQLTYLSMRSVEVPAAVVPINRAGGRVARANHLAAGEVLAVPEPIDREGRCWGSEIAAMQAI